MFLPEITKHSFGPAVTIEQKHMVFVEITFDVKIWLFHKMFFVCLCLFHEIFTL